jgi:hypothetical protein
MRKTDVWNKLKTKQEAIDIKHGRVPKMRKHEFNILMVLLCVCIVVCSIGLGLLAFGLTGYALSGWYQIFALVFWNRYIP